MQQLHSYLEYVMDDVLVLFIHFLFCTLHAVSHQKCVIGHEVRVPWPGFWESRTSLDRVGKTALSLRVTERGVLRGEGQKDPR